MDIEWCASPAYALLFEEISYKEMAKNLKNIERNKDDMIASLSHELRTPLGAIT